MVTYQRCACSLPVRDYLEMRGREYGIGASPHSDKCGVCHGPATDDEVADRQRWYYRLLTAIDQSKRGALIDKERDILAGMRLRYEAVS